MTEEEKRQQRAALLLQYEETREELQYLRNKAWNLSEDIGEISHWLREAREASHPVARQKRELQPGAGSGAGALEHFSLQRIGSQGQWFHRDGYG